MDASKHVMTLKDGDDSAQNPDTAIIVVRLIALVCKEHQHTITESEIHTARGWANQPVTGT